MFDLLEFSDSGHSYVVKPDGSFERTTDAATATGRWSTSVGDAKKILLALDDGTTDTFEVAYTFETGMKADNKFVRNILQITVKDGAGADIGSAMFRGTINIDDYSDIEFALPDGALVHIKCKLKLDGDYRKLFVDLLPGETVILGQPTVVQNRDDAEPEARDVFKFSAFTALVDLETGDDWQEKAKIKLKGHLEFIDNSLTFVAWSDGAKTASLTLAGKYKTVAGALEITKVDDDTEVLLSVGADLNFNGVSGEFGLSLGFSDTGFQSLNGDVSFENEYGETFLKGRLKVTDTGDGIDIAVSVKGTFKMGQDKLLKFEMAASSIGDKRQLSLTGTLVQSGEWTTTFDLSYNGTTTSFEIEFTTADMGVFFSVVRGVGREPQVGIGITYSFGTDGNSQVDPAGESGAALPGSVGW
ncbi:MAG: hypothetical protein ABJH07_07485 [Sedimentitalea sp.]|uniref:hypothetical protein n=1 Tax=Sedimentitalea sp. TaxID=2048915 RepID=UPI003263985D